MEASEDIDQERRRAKRRKRISWAKALLHPQTFKRLVTMGKLITQVLRIVYEIIRIFRE